MANSPGPSSSKAENDHNSNPVEDGGKKKKKTRRKPRSKSKKEVPDDAVCDTSNDEEAVPLELDFVIRSVKEPKATFYKQRGKALGHINLQAFIKDRIPCLFVTKSACDYDSSVAALEKFLKKLSIPNGICVPSGLPGQSAKKSDNTTSNRKEKKKKKKEPEVFPRHMSHGEVKTALYKKELIKGFIRINPKNFKESYVGNEDVSKADYIIASVLDRNRALDGDEVVLRLKTVTEDKKKLMEVVHISQKIHPRTAVGFLEPIEKNKDYAVFTPRDKRVPKVKIPKISWPSGFESNPGLYRDILLICKITEWREVRFALGTITENLGLHGDLKVESLAILRELCLDPEPYGRDIEPFLPKFLGIPKKEFELREDLRKECLFTIDPLTARDLDDAVSCKELPNGNFEVGVHISDASFYLNENTKLDEQVKKKATTIYMVDTAYHMLPTELCVRCSLLPGEDKLAFSVFWEMTAAGEVLNKRIGRTVINSCTQLAYEHAQMMIDEPERTFDKDDLPQIHNGFTARDLSKAINDLQTIAVCLREKRTQNGALKIDQVKISFSLDPLTGEPVNFWIYENKPSHRLIEEFMLLANMTVAEWIHDAFPDLAFLRSHEAPKPTMMNELQKNLETIGIHLDISSSGRIQSSLNKYVDDDFLGQCRMIVLNHLLTKPMKRAKYLCAGAVPPGTSFSHFALSVPMYTHFTSPIRRYADIMTHRLLAASLNYCDKPNWIPEEVAAIAERCNRQKYHAKKAGEASSDLYLVHYVEQHQPYVQQAVVVDTKDRSVDVIVLNTGSVLRLYKNNGEEENIAWASEEINVHDDISESANAKKMWKVVVTFPKTKTEPEMSIVLEMFTLVTVELSRKPKTNKLQAKLLRPKQ